MIYREYPQAVSVYKPTNYFERWYADVWSRHFTHMAAHDLYRKVLTEEMEQVGAKIEYGIKFKVTFPDDRDYLLFALRWS